jgi:hypothetical protein
MNLNRILSEGYGPGAWHGADIKAAIADVTAAQAFERPKRGFHNIAELALHHAFYVHSVRARLLGTTIEPFVLAGEDFFELEGGKPLSWKAVKDTLEDMQAKLVATVTGIESGTVTSALPPEERLTLALGITCHSAYHAGQIQLLKKIQG